MIKACIDPGHGGPDGRANGGPNGYIEADGVLKISKYLKDELLNTGEFEVLMTRETDITVSVRDRGRMAWRFGADIAISEHTNAATGTVRGAEVFYSVDLPGDKQFAADMATAISKAVGTANRGAKTKESTNYPGEDYYGFIDEAQDGGCKHVFIAESAFHDNPLDEAILLKDENLKKIAVAQAGVICKYFGVTYPVVKKNEIMGKAVATADQLYAYAINGNKEPKISTTLYELCNMFIEEGEAEGVRGDIAFCQACKETGFFAFGGLALPEWNNYCGLGVTGARGTDGIPIGNKFPDARTGARAQIQHLKAYASTDPLNKECVDIRFKYVTRGIAPNWEDLDGRWAVPGVGYGESIVLMFDKTMTYPPIDDTIPKGSLPRTDETISQDPVPEPTTEPVPAEPTPQDPATDITEPIEVVIPDPIPEVVTPTEEVTPDPVTTEPIGDELNVGLLNKILDLIFEFFSKLLGKK